jgi:hypothetical protein
MEKLKSYQVIKVKTLNQTKVNYALYTNQ